MQVGFHITVSTNKSSVFADLSNIANVLLCEQVRPLRQNW